MAGFTYRIDRFIGLDQSRDESLVSPSYSPDAMNMDTSDGGLMVTKGFSKYLPKAIPSAGAGEVNRILFYKNASGSIPVAVTDGGIFTYNGANETWNLAYEYEEARVSACVTAIMTRIGMTDTLLIADGRGRILKFDGSSFTAFGSAEGCSDIAVNFLAMFRSRLFSAGDAEHPDRLYYSKLPGGDRSIEDWGPDADSTAVEGGHIEIGAAGGDPITALAAMSNQLLIFKKNSIWRLIGDRPGNYTVELISRDSYPVYGLAAAVYRDVIYYVTKEGLCSFNGADASPLPDARMIKGVMASADTSGTRLAVVGDRLYFTVKVGLFTRLIEYDTALRRYMQYSGFFARDIVNDDGALIIADSTRYLEKWGVGDDFDGRAITAYWTTPYTDLGDKAAIKTLRALYLRGKSYANGRVVVETDVGFTNESTSILLPESVSEVAEVKLKNEGRVFRLKLANDLGGRFALTGGAELEMSVRKRAE
ncbi:MAG: hypothetical protein J5854_07830 [Clostridia bacterium]|nr:hypothetical protein [Clostridia bacterium]